jgi:hypothetical protein
MSVELAVVLVALAAVVLYVAGLAIGETVRDRRQRLGTVPRPGGGTDV